MIELMVVMTILVVVVSIFYQMVVSVSGLRRANRESAIAAEAARMMIETMRNEEFSELYALYNGNSEDDPSGPGTAPGHRFAVEGLRATDESPDGLVGEIFFPNAAQLPEGVGGAGLLEVLTTDEPWALREDLEIENLGMPRDLNGDNIIDARSHDKHYILLPVRIRLEWTGKTGPRTFEIFTMLAHVKGRV